MKVGSLCTGYGGGDMAVEQHFNATTVWVSDVDKNANIIIDQRFPGVPNLGDLTKIPWADVEPVDVMVAGFPCQPFSQAGKQKGVKDERHIWPDIAKGVGVLRPRWVVLENVRGAVRLALPTVLGDLSALGYDARWGVVRASEAGAPHRRERLFIVASDADGELFDGGAGQGGGHELADGGGNAAHPHGGAGSESHIRSQQPGQQAPFRGDVARPRLRRDAASHPGGQRHGSGQNHRLVGPVDPEDENQTRQRQRPRQESGDRDTTYGPYADAVHRWERVLGRTAPTPTEPTGRDGRPRLSPLFVEWMMGLPEGWVTDTGITYSAQLKALGNGVVPQQMLLSLQHLTGWTVS